MGIASLHSSCAARLFAAVIPGVARCPRDVTFLSSAGDELTVRCNGVRGRRSAEKRVICVVQGVACANA